MIHYFSIALVCLSLIYSAFMIWCLAGWRKIKTASSSSGNFKTFVSIVVPARNEEKNISNCLHDLLNQSYPEELVELIVVDDHSYDRTAELVVNIMNEFPNRKINLFCNDEKTGALYKKQAISAAIRQAVGELIVTTDADCRMPENWLASMVNCYEQERPDLIAGPVCFQEEKSFFEKIQSLEFMGLIGIGAGAISNHAPMMCNGANLAYTKKIFQEVNGFSGQPEMVSGDDTQLLIKISKLYLGRICFLKSRDAVVTTSAMSSLRDFSHQRKRWASKITFGMSGFTLLIATAAYFLHAALLILFFVSFFDHSVIPTFLFIFLLKCIAEYLLLDGISSFFRKKNLLWLFLPTQIFYMGYITYIGAASLVGSYTWKERKVKPVAIKFRAS